MRVRCSRALLFQLLLVVSFALCRVSECDSDVRRATEAFVCTNSLDACASSLEAQLRSIAPVDFGTVTLAVEDGLFCPVQDSACVDPQLNMDAFLAAVHYSRMVASVAQADEHMLAWKRRFDLLDELCGNAWAFENCDEDGCSPRNQTCGIEVTGLGFLKWVFEEHSS